MKRFKRWARPIFRVFNVLLLPLVLVMTAYLLVREDASTYMKNLHLRPGILVSSFLIATGGLLLSVWIWQQISEELGGGHHKISTHIRMYCYSALGDMLPGGIWKIVSRSTLYQENGDSPLITATASVTETLIVGSASMGLYALGTLLNPGVHVLENPTWGAMAALTTMVLIHPRVLGTLINKVRKQQGNGIKVHYTAPRLLFWLVAEMVVVSIGGLALFVLLNSLTSVSLEILIPIVIAWAAASAAGNLFFWLPGSPILRDGAMILILRPHLPLPVILTFVALIRLWSIVSLSMLAGGAWLLFPPKIHTSNTTEP